jgi:predicted acetyltransferase
MKVRQVNKDDFEKILELDAYCYGGNPKHMRERYEKRFDLINDQYLCMEIDGKVVANSRLIPLEQNIRGKFYPMGGIAMVVSAPEMRRKGHIRTLMLESFKKMQKDGLDVSVLYPFKDTFYANFGYVATAPTNRIVINPQSFSKWRNQINGYTVKRLSYSEGFDLYKKIQTENVALIHGAVRRDATRWKEFEQSNAWIAVAFDTADQPQGVMVYRTEGFSTGFDWAADGKMTISDIHCLTPEARKSLYHFIYVHTDQIVKVELPMIPSDYQIYPSLDNYCHIKMKPYNINMVRIINARKAIDGVPTKIEGELAIEISDAQIDENNQIFTLSSDGKQLTMKPNKKKQKIDAGLTIQGLTALLYGLLPVDELKTFQWIDEVSTNTKRLLDYWFPTKQPTLTEHF